jgi:hypothetical protein
MANAEGPAKAGPWLSVLCLIEGIRRVTLNKS